MLGERPRAPRHGWRPFILWLFLLALVGAVAVAFSSIGLDDDWDDDEPVHYAEPRVDVLGLDDDGVRLNLSMVAGVDVDEAILKDHGDAWWSNIARRGARAALGLGVKTVAAEVPEVAILVRRGKSLMPLLQIEVPETLNVPVIRRSDPLEPFAFEAIARPVAPMSDAWDWLQQAWKEDNGRLVVFVPETKVSIPFARWMQFSTSNVSLPFEGHSELPLSPSF